MSFKLHSQSIDDDNFLTRYHLPSVTLVDLKKSGAITKRPIQADAALMNPTSPILALRSAQTLQIFNLSEKKKVGEHTLSSPLVHWRWVDGNTLALVTSSSVYHWEALSPKPSSPKKVFERHASLPPAMQILQYEVTGDGKWCLIGGEICILREGVSNFDVIPVIR